MTIELTNVNPTKLCDELVKAGITPSDINTINGTISMFIDDSKHDAVMAIVAVHNPAPLPQVPSQLELLQKAVDYLIFNGGM